MSEKTLKIIGDGVQISDGYHTFDELYEHRIVLYMALCRQIHKAQQKEQWHKAARVWKSRLHSDGSTFDGWFVLGIDKHQNEQITYHLPESKWDECDFAVTLACAPHWDGHTSADVLERLARL